MVIRRILVICIQIANDTTAAHGSSTRFFACGLWYKHKDRALASENWREIRLDIDPAVQPDVIGTMTEMQAVVDASVDAVFSSRNIEHLFPEVPIALAEFHHPQARWFVLLACRSLSVCARVANDQLTDAAYQSGMGPITPWIYCGHRASMKAGNLYMAHRYGLPKVWRLPFHWRI